jgi:hypothetical protein
MKIDQEAREPEHARGAGNKMIETEMGMSGKHSFPGRLFLVEGIAGSAKARNCRCFIDGLSLKVMRWCSAVRSGG